MDKTKDVIISYAIDEKKIEFTIMDQGDGFDFSNVPDPTKPENLEKTHGRGIFLMHHLADEIDFDKNGSIVKMTFNL